jgi:polyphosphate glucokinase
MLQHHGGVAWRLEGPAMVAQPILGIDIGGSGIKGALVDVAQGSLISERVRLPTPQPARPEPVRQVVATLVQQFAWHGPVGCTFPAIIKGGVAYTAANVDSSWIGTNIQTVFAASTGCSIIVLNDADAAGLAELTFGAARGQLGTVLMLTFGTGIGSALLVGGRLVPNTELGHLIISNQTAEAFASDRTRKRQHLSWKRWARRLEALFEHLERLFAPDLFVVGGGVSKDDQHFLPLLNVRTPIVPAALRNRAGIIGAALAAAAALHGEDRSTESITSPVDLPEGDQDG